MLKIIIDRNLEERSSRFFQIWAAIAVGSGDDIITWQSTRAIGLLNLRSHYVPMMLMN
ncbi:hypothetical protein GTQ43_27880 [Nostoc sp. KVJ3]|uniref:hypothetical protein n=1 Tax=Nostoc sp. KVJ3 TaxID=457945 RepID=UPI0022370B7E|nr:hypothetical protein [Nostoc sp. KVJ3]MCW5317487.1 hypothetical protein [Nostoc sp. KVJ3]